MFEKPLPEWLAQGVKPPQEVINDGYTPGYKPPAEWENWLRNATYEAMKEMRANIESIAPSGMITMWSGGYSEIPDGWLLCDGNNGTPDLRDRFILGATSESEIGETGGEHEVTLTEQEMPQHNHEGETSVAGNHYHEANLSETDGDWVSRIRKGSTYDGRHQLGHEAGYHTHTFTTNNTGGGQPHENRPAFYKLAFIMKA